jgi:hypothetical protein
VVAAHCWRIFPAVIRSYVSAKRLREGCLYSQSTSDLRCESLSVPAREVFCHDSDFVAVVEQCPSCAQTNDAGTDDENMLCIGGWWCLAWDALGRDMNEIASLGNRHWWSLSESMCQDDLFHILLYTWMVIIGVYLYERRVELLGYLSRRGGWCW